jgi:PleD family two-component response regulator
MFQAQTLPPKEGAKCRRFFSRNGPCRRQKGVAFVSPVSILIIDGDDTAREYHVDRLKLSSADHQVFEATDGQSALELIRSRTFDCVILDLSLPDISGFEILVKLVPIASKPEIPVILLYKIPSVALFEVAMQNGAYACIHKAAVSGDLLDRTVSKALAAIPRSKTTR